MTAGQVAARVRAQHRQLAALHHALFSDRGERQAGAVPLRLAGPSVSVRRARPTTGSFESVAG